MHRIYGHDVVQYTDNFCSHMLLHFQAENAKAFSSLQQQKEHNEQVCDGTAGIHTVITYM